MMKNSNPISRIFVVILLVTVLLACFKVFQPFLTEIIAAAILVSIFYTPYEWLTEKLKGHKKTAAFITCILVALLVILPLTNFIVYTAQRSVGSYDNVKTFIDSIGSDSDTHLNRYIYPVYEFVVNNEAIKSSLLDIARFAREWFASEAGSILVGTANFFLSLVLIIFTMFFFFIDGEKMLSRLMYWTPLPNKYDKEIFKKFRDVSYTTMMSTVVTAVAQGLLGAIGLMIVGVPAFFAGIAMGFLSLLPYLGSALVWFPIGVYLLFTGEIWQGVFLLAYGGGVVSTADNLIRAYIIKGKAQVHPIFVIFSILGGIPLFGFWGVIFGPLIIAMAVTVLHIFEIEFSEVLEK